MKETKKSFKEIYKEQPGLFRMMLVLFALGMALFVYALFSLQPGNAVVKIGYGDVSSYRDGIWTEMLAFPVLAIILGILHNALAIKVYAKRGVGMAKVVVACSIALTLMAGLILMRILGDG